MTLSLPALIGIGLGCFLAGFACSILIAVALYEYDTGHRMSRKRAPGWDDQPGAGQ